MFRYTTYGVVFDSAIELPELIAAAADATAAISFGDVTCPGLDPAHPVDRRFLAADGGIYAWWHNLGSFHIRGGAEIVINPDPGVAAEVLRVFTLGTALGLLLHQRGRLVFHAGVIEIGDGALAIAGEKEAGKSTLAAALLRRGHRLLSDDLLCVADEAGQLYALPGYPQMKCWPDTCAVLGLDAEMLPRIHPWIEKRAVQLERQFSNQARRLRAIVLLRRRPDAGGFTLERLNPHPALLQLLPHWHGARFGPHLLRALGAELHFQHCARLSAAVPVLLLTHGKNIGQLDEIAARIEVVDSG